MTTPETRDPARREPRSRHFFALEVVTAAVLVLSVAALGWLLVVAWQPTWFRLASVQAEVVTVVALFTAALFLVSLVALVHTRG
jgi:hypothetical protein